MESEHTNRDGTLPTGLLLTQDIAALSADVDELIQQTEPQERMYEFCDEEDEDAYKDSNSEQSDEMQQQDDQSITELQDTPRIIDLLAESQEVITVKDIYTEWNLKAEYSKNPERDVLIMTNHPAFKHHMEVKPKGLHKQVFNFISYYELLAKRYTEADRNKLIHAVQNIPNPEIIRIQLGMLLKIINIYGNIGSVSAEMDKDTPYKEYESAQSQINSYYMANHIKIIPEVIGTQIPTKGKVNDLPPELRQVFASQHHFLCTE